MTGSPRLEDLRAEARYARERYDLYRAKMYGLRPTTITRLRELERMHEAALRSATTMLDQVRLEVTRLRITPIVECTNPH